MYTCVYDCAFSALIWSSISWLFQSRAAGGVVAVGFYLENTLCAKT